MYQFKTIYFDILINTDSGKSPSRYSGISDSSGWNGGSNGTHRHHLFHGGHNGSHLHHHHPLLSPQLDNTAAETAVQTGQGPHGRGIYQSTSSRVSLKFMDGMTTIHYQYIKFSCDGQLQ